MLAITRRAAERLKQIAEDEIPRCHVDDDDFGIRIVLSGPDNGVRGNKCRIGIGQAQADDLIIDVGGKKLLIDPATLTHLRHLSAILDLAQKCNKEELVLLVDGHKRIHRPPN